LYTARLAKFSAASRRAASVSASRFMTHGMRRQQLGPYQRPTRSALPGPVQPGKRVTKSDGEVYITCGSHTTARPLTSKADHPRRRPDICGCGDRNRLMRMEWLRARDNFPACWACFLVYDDRVEVLAITGSKQRIDQSMSPDEARALWADLCQCGWHRASEEEIFRHQMSHRKLRSIVRRSTIIVPGMTSS
jgi:hypothetical protein